MQLKNNSPVTMEKRTDLASLFCMIGRHGPAVAVAVIAVVSVVAGFIIYRTVKGRRRKAEAGSGDVDSSSSSSSRGAPGEESLQPEEEEELEPSPDARSRGKSTDGSEEASNASEAPVTRSPYGLRNRRTTAERHPQSSTLLKKEVEPENLSNASCMESSVITPTNMEDMKGLQEDACEVRDLNVMDESLKYKPVETPKDGEKVCSYFLEPEVVEILGNQEKGQKSKEEVSTNHVSTVIPCQENEKLWALNELVCHVENTLNRNGNDEKHSDQATPDSVGSASYSEESSFHVSELPLSTKNEEILDLDVSVVTKSSPANKDFVNVALHNHVDDQPKTVTSQTPPAISVDVDQSQNGETTERRLPSLGELSANSAMLSNKELEQYTTSCTKENIEDVKESSLGNPQETSVLVSASVLQCLLAEQETIQGEDQALPLTCLKPEDQVEVNPKLPKEASDSLFNPSLACPEIKVDDTIDVLAKELEAPAHYDLNAVVKVCAAVSELSCPDESSSQSQTNERMQHSEDLVVQTVSVPVMAESFEPQTEDQILYENPSNLTWCSADVGEESGISSMTVSPDLLDADECLASENVLLAVLAANPQSEDYAKCQHTVTAGSQTVINKEQAESAPDPQLCIEDTNKANDLCSANETVRQPTKALTGLCLNEDTDNRATKSIESDCVAEGKDEKTEINIMAATMDNNEWFTDGTDQVLPWMKPFVHSVPQINPVLEQNVQTTLPADAACTNPDVPPLASEEAKNLPHSDEDTETGKRVLAVQPLPQNVSVTFQIHYLTHSPYQKVAITGNHWELGSWKDFIPLEKTKDGFWATVISLPAERHVEWKFVIVDRGQVCRWEECGNRFLDTGNSENLLVQKCWGFL